MVNVKTSLAMMILYDQGAFELSDYRYLPEYENMLVRMGDLIEPCQNQIKIIDLLTHRSGFGYYSDVYGQIILLHNHHHYYQRHEQCL